VEKREIRVFDRTFAIEWGRIGGQANGAVIAREGDTVVLVAVVASEEEREGTDFLPLTVEYRERFSAAGRFPGGYRKREGAASEHEILTSRLIDRSIRPLFPEGFRNEVQLVATVLAAGPGGDPPIVAILGASAALTLSDIPWDGPIAPARIGIGEEGTFLANPNEEEKAASTCDLVLSFGRDGLVMAEGRAKEIAEPKLLETVEYAAAVVKPLLSGIGDLRAEGKPKRAFAAAPADPVIREAVEREGGSAVRKAVRTPIKHERRALLHETHLRVTESLAATFEGRAAEIDAAWHGLVEGSFRAAILEEGLRSDGRGTTGIRPISCEVAWLPRVHGSAIFTRGETQSIAVCTLGTGNDEQEVEGLTGTRNERFMLFYKFPPYSVGEIRPLRGPGRREIGHGNLARRALEGVLPPPATFPYTIKIESEITSSNGSSSMATVCGGCLSMMDAGIPILRPVAGIAMGLIREGERVVILSDILGDEDHLGDMDFKVAGSPQGITAVQLDNKIGAVPIALLQGALEQARVGRLHILAEMAKALPKPRHELSANAPRVAMIKIGRHRIRDLIGSGGRVIQELQADTGTKVDVEDDGTVRVYAQDAASLDLARKRIDFLTGEPEVGRVYRGVVTGVKEFGVFVRLFAGIEGLVHVTELAPGPIRDISQVASEGDEMIVRVLGIDGQGKIRLSRKQAMNVPESEIANA
jgi:polyribonucleotide nucleotidyltransferase